MNTIQRLPGALRYLSIRVILILSAFAALHSASLEAAEAKQANFRIPAGALIESLKLFTEQSGEQVVYATQNLRGFSSNAVQGMHTPREALELLVSGTPVVVVQDAQTGALSLARKEPTPAGKENSEPKTETPRSPSNSDDTLKLEEMVVTGRAGVDARPKVQTSYSITTESEEQLRMRSPMGVAESLKSVPGLWVEASGGEASANIRARGIPTEGYSTINLLEDGLPIQHDPGLGYLNADQTFRLDETVQRMEVVRGGPSSVFTSNAPGGAANYVTRNGSEGAEGIFKYETGDFGHHRFDAYYGGPIGEWRASVGGFYRFNDGVRDPGYTFNDGGQIRFSLGRDLPGGGKIDFNVKRIDDNVGLYLGIPLTFDSSGDVAAVPGFDANKGTLNGPETTHFSLPTGTGKYDFDLPTGTGIKLTQLTLKFEQPLGDGWNLQNGARYRDSMTIRNGLFPATLSTGTARLASAKSSLLALYPTATDVQLRYVSSPNTVFDTASQNGNGLVMDASVRSVTIPEKEFLDDLKLLKKFEIAGQSHDIAIGAYVAHVSESFQRYSAQLLTDVRSQASLLNLVAVDAAGKVVGYGSENGFTRYGNEFANGHGSETSSALYASDEWKITRKLRLDAGARWEKVELSTTTEGNKTVNLGVSPTPADRTVLTGNGIFTPANKSYDATTWTVGLNYQITPRSGLFARYSAAHRLPSVGDFITNPSATPTKPTIGLSEAGFKYNTKFADLYATAFHTSYDSYGFSELVFNSATNGYDTHNSVTDTKAYGLELEGTLRPLSWFEISAAATFQKTEFGDFKYISAVTNGVPTVLDFTGNRLLRVPDISARVIPAVILLERSLRLELPVEHYGDRYADAANTVKLPAYTVLNFRVRYDLTRQVTLYGYIENLTNEIGLTEGNPRAGQFASGDAGAKYYIARPILGRSIRAAIMYRF